RCPKCGGRLMKRTGVSKKTGKQYTYYCCEFVNNHSGGTTCDFMSWDVPVKDDCPVCGQTMFKRAGRGFKRPFCINPACSNFLPEDKRGYYKKTDKDDKTEKAAPKKAAPKKTASKKTAPKGKKA
ncbi:MAG: DNA topoisomerase I, partial [Oscillospiraceae bacterium]|nr:DNA topoisomerase I [Oscillospiraceae bacterium]